MKGNAHSVPVTGEVVLTDAPATTPTVSALATVPAAHVFPRSPLEPNHSHAISMPGASWEQQPKYHSALARSICAGAPAVTIIANGGLVSCYDVLHSLQAGIPVIVREGTGRLADETARSCYLPCDSRPATLGHAEETRGTRSGVEGYLCQLGLVTTVNVHGAGAFAAALQEHLCPGERVQSSAHPKPQPLSREHENLDGKNATQFVREVTKTANAFAG